MAGDEEYACRLFPDHNIVDISFLWPVSMEHNRIPEPLVSTPPPPPARDTKIIWIPGGNRYIDGITLSVRPPGPIDPVHVHKRVEISCFDLFYAHTSFMNQP